MQTIISNNLKKQIADFFGVDIHAKGNIPVPCPLHDDLNPSASLHLQKGLFNCHAKCGGFNFQQLEQKINQEKENYRQKEEMQENTNTERLPATKENLKKLLGQRKISDQMLKKVDAYPDFKSGRLIFPYSNGNGTGHVGRTFTNDPIKYLNSKGEKGLYGFKKGVDEYFLVEGIFDALSLKELGYNNVCSSLGSSLSEHQAYLLRNSTVYILYDPDFSGWKGSINVSKTLADIGANPIILNPPHEDKDINKMFQTIAERKTLKNYLGQAMAKYTQDDVTYVDRLFSGRDRKLNMIKTGIHKLDYALGGVDGGWIEGLNVIWAETGNAKSFFCLFMALTFALQGKKVFYNTTELSIRQCWARIASYFSTKHSWQELEKHPERLERHVKPYVDSLAKNLKIVAGWKISEVKRISKNYDVLIIDYIQRMPGLTDQEMTNMNINLGALSDIARDEYKIILVVSSLNRASYENTKSISAGKGSGNIEYMSQLVARLTKLDNNQPAQVQFDVIKNTRYTPDQSVLFHANLSNLNFKC